MTYQCPQCHRQIRTLDDEYGDHGCPCGWEPWSGNKIAVDLGEDYDGYHNVYRGNGTRTYNEGDDAE
jgi:hypothetical protein